MPTTVREFIRQSYRIISSNSPTQPLHGDDQKLAIDIMNDLIASYASSGLLLTIAKTTSVNIVAGQQEVITGPASYLPVPDITLGRVANINSAWLLLDGVEYPLRVQSNEIFLSSYRYSPLTGLPIFLFPFFQTDTTDLRLYPAPSQTYEFFIRAKFQVDELTSNDDMSGFPSYYKRFLKYATMRDVADFKGRSEAWTDKLEASYQEALLNMQSASETNLLIEGGDDVQLNGANRVRAGV